MCVNVKCVDLCSHTSGDSDRAELAMGGMGQRVLHDITLETYSLVGKCVMETVSYAICDGVQFLLSQHVYPGLEESYGNS